MVRSVHVVGGSPSAWARWVETCMRCALPQGVVSGSAGDVDHHEPSATKGTMNGLGIYCSEGPRRDAGSGDERSSPRAAARQSPLFRGRRRRPDADGDPPRESRRRRSHRYARSHQAPVRPAPPFVPLGIRGNMGSKRESQGPGVAAAPAGQPRQLCPHVPRRPPCKEAPLLVGGQLFDPLHVQLDAGGERRLRFLEGGTEARYVEVDADRFPVSVGPVSVAPQRKGHAVEYTIGPVPCATDRLSVRGLHRAGPGGQ